MTRTLIDWNDSFLIGIDELDHEHKNLIKEINRLHDELAGNEKMSGIRECLGEIYAHMEAHFALEEHVMKEHEYRFFDEHKREHEEFLENYASCMVDFLNGEDISSKKPIEECLKQWVIEHILTSDKKMALMVEDKVA